MPSEYQMFVKNHIGQFSHLPPRQRISEVAKLYRESGQAKAPTKKYVPKKQVRGKGLEQQHGAGLFDALGSILGLGLPMEKKQKKAKAPKAPKANKKAKGAGLFDIIPHLLTAGLF